MEAVVKNLESTLELLALSQTEYVKQWDEGTVERALQWSNYCEHIYNKFNANTNIRSVIEKRLQQTNEHLRKTFTEYQDTSFVDLGRCRDLLLASLLKNPACPCSVLKTLFGGLKSQEGSDGDDGGPLGFSNLPLAISCKSACEVLGTSNVSRATCGLCMDVVVKGSVLREHIDKLLSHPGNESLVRHLLDSLTQSSSWDSGPQIIAGALLSCDGLPSCDTTRDFMFSWLQAKPSLLLSMCQTLPVVTLAGLAQQSESFRLAYMSILKNWASALAFDVTVCEWVTSEENGVPLETLTEHCKALLSGGHSLEKETLRELHDLKERDGGFEERGLSLWSDVLSQLSTA